MVFWIDPSDNTHGLVCAIDDQSAGIQWYNGSFTATGATNEALGTGSVNTNFIISNQGSPETNYAAGLARAYNGGGYNDWYLPSKDELNEMHLNKAAIDEGLLANSGTTLSTNYYWSSSEDNSNNAWIQYLGTGNQFSNSKNGLRRVRAIRAF